MSWQQQGNFRYYYQTKRDNEGRRLKLYCGRGPQALQAYQLDLEARAKRRCKQRHEAKLQDLDRLTQEFFQATRILAHATYYSHGWYQHHRGEFRRRRTITEAAESKVMTTSPLALEPSIDQMRTLVNQAQAGNRQCVPQIKELLDQCPSIWEEVYSLAKRVENAWISAIAGKDLLSQETLKRQVQALRLNLAEASTDPIENLLIDVVCSTYLVRVAKLL